MSGNIRFRLDLSGEDFSPTGSISLNRVLQRVTLLLNDHQTYIMYHGTTRASAQQILRTGFHQSKDGMLGRGVYLSIDLQKASRYPINHPEEDKVVIKVMVNVGKVIAINYQNHPLQKTWHYYGFNTAWVPPNCGMVPSGLEEDCVWDPRQIWITELITPRAVQVQPGY
uniref:PARP catalytic domain-containing protein n=1 Tax=Fundulus heteroclitus TaxID=8078 RepID=A0A3Q2PPN5_FUNHE